MRELRFAILGTGFWSRYQLAAWQELKGARCVALYNRTRSKAENLASHFGIKSVYDDALKLMRAERPDFVDIITDVATHRQFVELALGEKIPVVCQKPMAPSLSDARAMVQLCQNAGVPFYVHENWRWQTPIRELKNILNTGVIGRVFRARITYSNSFNVFANQPFLRELDQFILTDIGTHILDSLRMLFGEARTLFCQTSRVRPDIKGEDVATVMLQMQSGATVTCEMSYSSKLEHERFPETYVVVEGTKGSIELGPDYWIRVTTDKETHAQRFSPPKFSWVDPAYELSQSSGVACNANLLGALAGTGVAETTGEDNLKTLELVYACYESARVGTTINLSQVTAHQEIPGDL